MKTQFELRSREDYELEREFIDVHTKAGAIIDVSESGRPVRAVYENPIYSFYRGEPNVQYAYSDMTKRIDKVIKNGPEHPEALENVKKIMDGTI